MKRSIALLFILSIALFLPTQKAKAWTLDPNTIKNIFATATPIHTPTPVIIKQLDPNIIQKMPIVTLGAKNTVTPTPTPETKATVTPTVTETVAPTATSAPEEQEKATDTGTVTTETATPTATQTGIQTKDIVTYVLIGAILLVLIIQAFSPKKDEKKEEKTEGPKEG